MPTPRSRAEFKEQKWHEYFFHHGAPQRGEVGYDPDKYYDPSQPQLYPPLTPQQEAWLQQRTARDPNDVSYTRAEQDPVMTTALEEQEVLPAAIYSRNRRNTVGEILLTRHGIEITPEISAELLRVAGEYAQWSSDEQVHVLTTRVGSFADFAVYREEVRAKVQNLADRRHFDATAARLYDQAVYYAAQTHEARRGLKAARAKISTVRNATEMLDAKAVVQQWEMLVGQSYPQLMLTLEKLHELGQHVEVEEVSRVEAPAGMTPNTPLDYTPPPVHLGYDPRKASGIPRAFRGAINQVTVPKSRQANFRVEEADSLLPEEPTLMAVNKTPTLPTNPQPQTFVISGGDDEEVEYSGRNSQIPWTEGDPDPEWWAGTGSQQQHSPIPLPDWRDVGNHDMMAANASTETVVHQDDPAVTPMRETFRIDLSNMWLYTPTRRMPRIQAPRPLAPRNMVEKVGEVEKRT